MKTHAKLLVIVSIASLYLAVFSSAQTRDAVQYPEGYRLWTHVKSGIVGADKPGRGLHNIYANPKALEGFRTGRFDDGAVIVFDLLDLSPTTGIGDRRRIDVMHKDKKKFATTGGWGFEEFRANSRTQRDVGENAVAKCFTCHQKQKDKGYVFSSFKD